MLILQTQIHVDGLTGREVFDFLADCADERYQRWWPGVHLQFHALQRRPDHVGDVVYMDEYVGSRRVRLQGVLIDAVPGSRLVWQMRHWLPLPVWLSVDVEDDALGVRITHTTRAGFGGLGKLLDPLFRLYFTPGFARSLDRHVREEFPRLEHTLHSGVLPSPHQAMSH